MRIVSNRPNVVSAKVSGLPTYGELAEQRAARNRKDGTPRMMTKDLCDFCLALVYLYKRQLGLRLRGKKFVCEVCRFENGRQEEAMKIGALPCWQHYGAWGKWKSKPNV